MTQPTPALLVVFVVVELEDDDEEDVRAFKDPKNDACSTRTPTVVAVNAVAVFAKVPNITQIPIQNIHSPFILGFRSFRYPFITLVVVVLHREVELLSGLVDTILQLLRLIPSVPILRRFIFTNNKELDDVILLSNVDFMESKNDTVDPSI
jgi:hypothetical protein